MIGRNISNYHISELLGEGGMGTVYKATDKKLNRTVAIKMLHDSLTNQAEYLQRFKNEAQLSARISHPNVATLFDFQTIERSHFIVMEYVEGKPLDEILQIQEKLSPETATRIAIQILEGLGAAHDMGILHRDLKPGNIMITKRGYVKLMDFGIARLESAARITRENNVIGTLEYLSPELVKGKEPAKTDDLYALGIMLYEMLTGEGPYNADSDAALMYQIAHKNPEFNLFGIDKRLINTIKKLTHKQAQKRYQDTREVIHDLEAITSPGKVNPNLLYGKVIHEERPSQEKKFVLAALNNAIPKGNPLKDLPEIKVPEKLPLKLPFLGIDIRIVGVALFLCLLILILGIRDNDPKKPQNTAQSDTEIVHGDEENDNNDIHLSQNTQSNQLAPVQPNTPSRIPPYRKKAEKKDESGTRSRARTDKPDRKGNESQEARKHEIKKLEGQSNEDNDKVQEQKEEKNVISKEESRDNDKQEIEEKEKSSQVKTLTINYPDIRFSAKLLQTISSEKDSKGKYLFFETTRAVAYNRQIIAPKGAKVRAQISKVRSKLSGKKAFLGIEIQSIQMINGEWLEVDYPEYSDTDRQGVQFNQGLVLNDLKLKAGRITIKQ